MNIPLFDTALVGAFILVLIRVSSILFMIPVFGDAIVPAMVKWGLAILIAMLLFPLVRSGVTVPADLNIIAFVLKIAGEIIVGICIGFTARFVFAGIQLAGELLGFQMGLSMASVIDPTSNLQVTVLGEFQYLVAVLLFMGVNAHHIFISAIVQSFQTINPSHIYHSKEVFSVMLHLSQEVFVIALKISAPITAVLLFTTVAMGIVARTVPQMNVFVLSFPLQISVGLIFLGLSASVFAQLVEHFFSGLSGKIVLLTRLL